ncbi:MAG: hypothetical protein A2017_02765 [Lentisphaerae bacterium GWF2_44_16]|nr:MAG: hypothetical protein A2017_02765 [Lentisphaerae bacterium GWF2_44_16]
MKAEKEILGTGKDTPFIFDLARGRVEGRFNVRQGSFNEKFFHCHPHFELLYIVEGEREVIFKDRRYKASAGELLIYCPGDVHNDFGGTPSISYFTFRFRPDELRKAALDFPDLARMGPVVNVGHKEEFLSLFSKMFEEFENPGEGGRELLNAYLIEFIIKFRRALNKKRGKSRAKGRIGIERIMELMQKNISDSLDLNRIAGKAFMSVSHFSKSFREKTGESPKRYFIRERIEKAQELLRSTKKTAKEIAEELGYSSHYFFYRQFRLKTGMTADEYRRKDGRRS